VADYSGEVKFAEDEEPVWKTLTNVVLGTFDLRKVTPAVDFEFRKNSNATDRSLADVMVRGTGGVGQLQTITYTHTQFIVTTPDSNKNKHSCKNKYSTSSHNNH